MSTDYFLLTKSFTQPITNDDDNQLLYLKNKQTFLLPSVNFDYYAKHGLFEKHLIEWSKQFCLKDKLFLDIGAHTGTYSLAFANLCKEVHAFEPQRMTFYALCGSIALSNLTNVYAHPFGLGSPEQVGQQPLFIVSNDGGGSSLHTSQESILSTESIEIKTLDSIALRNIGFIKMDIENNELFLLKGAKQTLQESGYPPILFESNHQNQELFDYLTNEFGYQVNQLTGTGNMYLASLQ